MRKEFAVTIYNHRMEFLYTEKFPSMSQAAYYREIVVRDQAAYGTRVIISLPYIY